MADILISGCSGFLAQHLIARLARLPECRLHGITEEAGYGHPAVNVHTLDLRDEAAVSQTVRQVHPDLTFHLAAISNVGFSWKHPGLTYGVNIVGSAHLLEALAAEVPRSRVILMSSGELYQAQANRPARGSTESSPLQASNPYALSKWTMEKVAGLYAAADRLAVVIIRCFNFTGPGQDRKFVTSDFAAQIAEIEKGKREPCLRVGNLAAVRDFSDVRDIARYLEVIGERGQAGQTYNLCSGKRIAVGDLLRQLLALARVPIEVAVDPARFRPSDTPEMNGDCRLIRDRFGLVPAIPIEQTLADLLDDWRQKI